MFLLQLLSENPALRLLQLGLLTIAVFAVFFVFYATRDALQRSNSFVFQVFTVVLVACLPFIGFLIYLLIRPSLTLRQKQHDEMLASMLSELQERHAEHKKYQKHQQHKDEQP